MMTTTFMYMSYLSVIVLVVLYMPLCIAVLWAVNSFLKKVSMPVLFRKASLGILIIILFLLPTWDAILGKYYLDKYCEQDGGTYINHEEHIDGIYFLDSPRRDIAEGFLARGFLFIEMGHLGNYVRYSMKDDGSLIEINVDNLLSRGIIVYESRRARVGPSYLNVTVENQYLREIDSTVRYGGFRNYQVYTWLDKKVEGVGSLSSTRCTDNPKFKKQDRFKSQTQYLNILANIEH